MTDSSDTWLPTYCRNHSRSNAVNFQRPWTGVEEVGPVPPPCGTRSGATAMDLTVPAMNHSRRNREPLGTTEIHSSITHLPSTSIYSESIQNLFNALSSYQVWIPRVDQFTQSFQMQTLAVWCITGHGRPCGFLAFGQATSKWVWFRSRPGTCLRNTSWIQLVFPEKVLYQHLSNVYCTVDGCWNFCDIMPQASLQTLINLELTYVMICWRVWSHSTPCMLTSSGPCLWTVRIC